MILFIIDFVITYPSGGEILKNGSKQKVVVDIKTSGIKEITAVDLFYKNGTYYGLLWSGNQDQATVTANTITVTFPLQINPQVIPGIFFYRVWGQEPAGPNCFKTSKDFAIEK